MDNQCIDQLVRSFSLSNKSASIVCMHLKNKSIYSEDDMNDRGSEVEYVCHIAKIIETVKKGAVSEIRNDQIQDFRKSLLDDGAKIFFIPYDFIAFYIFEDKEDYEPNKVEEAYEDIVNASNATFFDENKIDDEAFKRISLIFKKIQRHILLAIHQKQYILHNIEDANQQLQEIKREVNSVQEQAISVQEQSDSTLKRVQNVISTYVAILGIFATILLAVVGGINLLDSAAKYIRYKQEFILYISVGVFSLSLIIYFLFTWIDKLQGNKTTEYKKEDCWVKKVEYILKNYGFFVFILSLLLVIVFSYYFDSKKLSTPLGNVPGPFSEAPYQYLGIWDIPPDKLSNIRFEEDN